MTYSAYKLNKQGDNIQPWRTPFPIWNQSAVLYIRFNEWCLCSDTMSCLTLWTPNPPGSYLSVGFFRQAYWSGLPFSSSRGSFQPRDWTRVSYIGRRILYHWATQKAPLVNDRPLVMFFELIRDILKGRTLHKRITAIGFQTAVPSIPMVDKAKRELLLRSKLLFRFRTWENKRILSSDVGKSILTSQPLWTTWGTDEGAVGYTFSSPYTIGE